MHQHANWQNRKAVHSHLEHTRRVSKQFTDKDVDVVRELSQRHDGKLRPACDVKLIKAVGVCPRFRFNPRPCTVELSVSVPKGVKQKGQSSYYNSTETPVAETFLPCG